MEGAGVVCRPERRTSGNTVQYGSSASNAVATLFVLATGISYSSHQIITAFRGYKNVHLKD